MVPVGYNLFRGRDRVIRVPSRGITRGSGQGILGTDKEVSGRAIRVRTAIRTSRVRMVNSSFSRASGGTVTATRVGGSRDREGGTSQGSVLFVARLVINARTVLIGAGSRSSSRVLDMSHRGHFSHQPFQLQPRCQLFQPFQQFLCSRDSYSMDVSIMPTRQRLRRHHPRLRVCFLSMVLWVGFCLIRGQRIVL